MHGAGQRLVLEHRQRRTLDLPRGPVEGPEADLEIQPVARSLGLEVPRDLSVISFDNTPLVHFTQPPLTAIDQPIAETVSRAVEQLIARGPDGADDAVIEVAAALVERLSTAPAPGSA